MLLERRRLVSQYKIELDNILIPSDALHLVTVIGEGLLMCPSCIVLKLYAITCITGAFGLVYESIYTDHKTGTSINVAIKGLKGILHNTLSVSQLINIPVNYC